MYSSRSSPQNKSITNIGCIREDSKKNKATYEIKEYVLQYLNFIEQCLLQNIQLSEYRAEGDILLLYIYQGEEDNDTILSTTY